MNNPWDDIAPPKSEISARRVDHTHPLDFFWACNHTNQYMLIYEFSSTESREKIVFPDLSGIQPGIFSSENDTGTYKLVLILKEQENWEIFLSLCKDLVIATRHAKNSLAAIRIIVQRLSRWKELLNTNRTNLLSEEKIKGLIGELLFLKNHLSPSFGIGQAVKFWQGPDGSPQDFNVNDCAIEIKCQSGVSAPFVRISSAEQLCPQLPKMYLFIVTLGSTTTDHNNVINIPTLVREIREMLIDKPTATSLRFSDLLYATGYMDSSRYLYFNYVLAGEKMFQVSDGFPRICPDHIHSGIAKLSYMINLSSCTPFENQPDWIKTL